MTYDDDKDKYTLKSGNSFYSNNGIIGIDNELFVTEGYDGYIGSPNNFTPEDRAEIADYMISLWEMFRTGTGKCK